MEALKKYGKWLLLAVGALALGGWAYQKFVKKEPVGFGGAKKVGGGE